MIRSRLLFSGLVVFAAFGLVVLSALRLAQPQLIEQSFSKPVFALVNPEASQAGRLVVQASNLTPITKVDYKLPYPGILPNHPLYWLKMLRDRARLTITKEPLAKFELLLLFADKRLGAGEALVLSGQEQLGVTTITKAEKYLLRANEQFQVLLAQNKLEPRVKEQFAKAFLKHQEVVEAMLDTVLDNEKPTLQNSLELNTNIFQNKLADYVSPQILKETEASPTAVLK